MTIFNRMETEGFEQVIYSQDQASGLKAITVLHDTTLGPAIGGIRYWAYKSDEEALTDALRLAKGMTYKNAAAGLPNGGGKTVFIKDPTQEINEEALFRAFGRLVEGMNGRYIPSVDVGTTTQHLDYMSFETNYIVGSNRQPGASGNPSPSTAHGVYLGIKAAAYSAYGDNSLKGRTILLEGAGKVGLVVAEKAIAEGANVIATDISEASKQQARNIGCEVVAPDELLTHPADIYTPCALGGTLNDETIEQLDKIGIQIVAGAANNQLAEERHGEMLKDKGILYIPDYIINSGGVIHVADELNGGFDADRALKAVEMIYHQILKVLELAETENLPTNIAANLFAEKRIQAVAQTKKIFTGRNE